MEELMNDLLLYDAARKALSESLRTDEVKSILDKAKQYQAAARIAKDKSLEADAFEIRRRAERRLGELMREQKETVGMNPGTRLIGGDSASGGSIADPPEIIPTLADAGIDKHLADTAPKPFRK